VQIPLPVAFLYFPVAHAVQGPPSGPVYPGLQVVDVDGLHLSLHDTQQVVHTKSVIQYGLFIWPFAYDAQSPYMLVQPTWSTHGPAGVAVHDVAPTVSEYVPRLQLVQSPLPLAFLYVPSPHATHVPPFGPLKPALQAQAALPELELGELEFPGQLEHADTPPPEYDPAGQDAHCVPLALEYDPAGQDVHPVALSVEYDPDTQAEHKSLPVVLLYVPPRHDTHGPTVGPVKPGLHKQLYPS